VPASRPVWGSVGPDREGQSGLSGLPLVAGLHLVPVDRARDRRCSRSLFAVHSCIHTLQERTPASAPAVPGVAGPASTGPASSGPASPAAPAPSGPWHPGNTTDTGCRHVNARFEARPTVGSRRRVRFRSAQSFVLGSATISVRTTYLTAEARTRKEETRASKQPTTHTGFIWPF